MTALLAAQAAPMADFSQDTWWIWLIKAVGILVFLVLNVILALWVERRGLGRMQTRPGPNVLGPLGFFQALADALKLVLKEDFWLKGADRVIYMLGPVIAATSAFMIFAVIPMGGQVSMFGIETPIQLTDTPVAVLYILAIASLGVYGIVLGGWASGSTYPLLGAVRSSAQVISYELAMSLSLVSVFLMAGSMSTSQIVGTQTTFWWGFVLIPSFVLYVISMVGEVNRLPFDLPEAEGELVSGFMTEYSSMKFAWFFLAEYINMLNVSAVATTLFAGGYLAPFGLNMINQDEYGVGMLSQGWLGFLWFFLKMWFFMFLMVWTRGTLLRFRYDFFMNLGWKVLIPVGLVWVVALACLQAVIQFGDLNIGTFLILAAVMFVLVLGGLTLFGTKTDEDVDGEKRTPITGRVVEDEVFAAGQDFDAFSGGYPVPPLPGQSLPPSPRRAARAAARAGAPTAGGATTATSTDDAASLPDPNQTFTTSKEDNDG